MKTCSKCGKKKEITEFWKNGDTQHSSCKECNKTRRRITGKRLKECLLCGLVFKESHMGQECCNVEHQKLYTQKRHNFKEKELREDCSKTFYKEKLWFTQPYNKSRGSGYKKDYIYARFSYIKIPEHRLIMMRKLGRELKIWEHVHHINGIKNDNREENLVVIGREQHFTVTMAMEENNKLRNRIIALEEEMRNFKVKQQLKEVSHGG